MEHFTVELSHREVMMLVLATSKIHLVEDTNASIIVNERYKALQEKFDSLLEE